ncbi:alpha/beta hydrolase [Dongia mobilis]|uniref:alpha/beta hydrolase n=1 Tax=Dongia mobilis TaxID=578943 RepID=UPI00105B6294|nr:alpha/beta hydrolase [Dongia mobilis]
MSQSSTLARLFAKPWVDPLCLWGMGWLLPAARCWGAAFSGDEAEFARELGLSDTPPAIATRVRQTGALRKLALVAQAEWEAAAFETAGDLPALERTRRATAHDYLGHRFSYLWFARRRRVPAARLDVPVLAELDTLDSDPDRFFALGQPVPVTRSVVIDHADVREYWLRLNSPDAPADQCYVHVYEGRRSDGRPLPSLIFGHGLGMEMEMMKGDMRGYRVLAAAHGCRILLPDAPGHNRRVAAGSYGGESFIMRPPLSGLLHFRKAARELGAIIAWCRGEGSGRVALGGISLGALTAQVTAQRMGTWPEAARPDGLLLLTTTDAVSALTFQSSLARITGLAPAAERAGWNAAAVARMGRYTDSEAPAPVAPENIVLLIGERDDVTPYDGGRRLAEKWQIPPENLFVRNQGHFSAAIGLGPDPAPFSRILALLNR